MNAAFSFPISMGIIAFGIWIAAGTIGGSSPLSWALTGLLAVIVGSISLCQAIRDLKWPSCASPDAPPRLRERRGRNLSVGAKGPGGC